MNLPDALAFVSPKVRDAALATSTQLKRLGIRHALAGGLAVGAHGYLRATVDVDFLVGEEAFEKHGMLVTFKAGVPIEIDGIKIDYLSPAGLGPQVNDVFNSADASGGIAVVPSDVLIYMKLVAWRRRDQLDVVELLRAGADEKQARTYLETFAPDLLPRFDELAAEALSDE